MLISVEHGHRRLTLSVPGDLAVEALLPILVDACGADVTASWALLPRGGPALPPERSLAGAGLGPGALLALRMTGPGERPVPATWRAARRAAELERALAAAPRSGGAVIALSAPRSGGGATTVTALLATLLARTFAEPPFAIDGDLERRSLSQLLGLRLRVSPATYADLVTGRLRAGDIPRPLGVEVLPAPEPAGEGPVDAAACTAMLGRLRAAGRLVLLDCPAGLGTAWGQAAWAAADQVVLVADGRTTGAAEVTPVAEGLTGAGLAAVVVANRVRAGARPTRALAAALGAGVPVVAVPRDPVASALLRAGQLTPEATPEAWRRAAAQLATTLAAGWG
jgi:MinD-like ATPase involved in chromosome partitioning or flagellar assembly